LLSSPNQFRWLDEKKVYASVPPSIFLPSGPGLGPGLPALGGAFWTRGPISSSPSLAWGNRWLSHPVQLGPRSSSALSANLSLAYPLGPADLESIRINKQALNISMVPNPQLGASAGAISQSGQGMICFLGMRKLRLEKRHKNSVPMRKRELAGPS
jgi:hypothetical protein